MHILLYTLNPLDYLQYLIQCKCNVNNCQHVANSSFTFWDFQEFFFFFNIFNSQLVESTDADGTYGTRGPAIQVLELTKTTPTCLICKMIVHTTNRPCSCTLFHLMSNPYSHGSLQLLVLFSGIWVFLECVLGSGLVPVLASFLNPPTAYRPGQAGQTSKSKGSGGSNSPPHLHASLSTNKLISTVEP